MEQLSREDVGKYLRFTILTITPFSEGTGTQHYKHLAEPKGNKL